MTVVRLNEPREKCAIGVWKLLEKLLEILAPAMAVGQSERGRCQR
ncbi:MAG: hypothetical protein ABI725_01185 [Chloroflexota bacterium]